MQPPFHGTMDRAAPTLQISNRAMEAFESFDRLRLLAAGLHLLPALAWAILARSSWRSRDTALMRLFRLLSGLLAVQYGVNVVIDLVAPAAGARPGALYAAGCALTQATTLVEMPVLRHLIPLGTLGGKSPGRLWLAVNYGSAALLGLAIAWIGTSSPMTPTLVHLYLLVMTAVIVFEALRLARGRWRPLILADLRFTGLLVVGLTLFAGVVAIVFIEQRRLIHSLEWIAAHSFVGLALAAVFALRILGEVVRRFLVAAASIAVVATIYFGAQALGAALPSQELRRIVDLGGVVALVLALGPGMVWLKVAVDRIVLRQSRRWGRQLLAFLETMSPERGVAECCRRAVAEVARVLKLRGAGILLTNVKIQGHGRLARGPLSEIWPRGSDALQLPDRAFDLLWLQEVELQEALYDAEVTWVVPIRSPQKLWGHLFVSAGALGTAAGGAKLETLESFTRQLALVLDSADLLGRAVTVERELAQAEKLAAVGEMAARVAHEIRNPVTAARSLAQTLAREPNSPANAEHAEIITRELDRVEHQVRSLLEFARRETYRFEPVRLAELVRATLADLEPCLKGDEQIDLDLELDPSVIVRADPERLRQVLINLVENAADALRDQTPPRRLAVSVAGDGPLARLSVRDTGPGIPDDVLPRIFDPFYSQKTQGTGLGLAIARRIVEAQGGRIEAGTAPGGGMVFRVELPLVAHLETVPAVAGGLEQAI